MHATLTDLAKAVSGETEPSRDAWLTVAVLQKRAFSSAYALARSLLRHPKLGAIDPGDPEAGQQLLLPLVDAGDLDASDEPPVCISPVLRDAAAERRLVNVLAARAAAAARREAKLLYLERLLRRFGRLNERAIVFTEYRDTLLHVRERLSCDCAVLHGGLTREERRLQLERFSSGGCRVLLATDAAGEGLNLHAHCRTVINLELPWNPMRLEQRIGRVDRIGQQKRVHAFHLISRGTGEVRILDHLRAKLARARADVSVADPLGWGEEPDDRLLAEIAAGVESTDHSQSIVSHQPADHPDHVVFAHLEPEAAAEFQRLAAARRFSAAIPFDAESEDCMAIATRRTSTRARLNGRVLAIACAEVSDPFGRTIASRVLPLLATASRNRSRATH
jgi:hypothetical protein